MPPLPPHKKKALVIGAAVAIPATVAAVYAAIKLRKRSKDGKKKAVATASADAVKGFSEAEVSGWLAAIGVSADTVALFASHGVDGATLLLLREAHLAEMGVAKIGDRLKLKAALGALRGEAAPVAEAPAKTISSSATSTPRKAAKTSVAAPTVGAEEEAALRVAAVTQMVVENLEELFGVFGSDEFIALPAAQQRSLIANAEATYVRVVASIQQLPPAHQQKLLQFADNFGQLLGEVKRAFAADDAKKSSSRSASAAAAAANAPSSAADTLPEEASAQAVQQLLPLLKQFHEALESPAMLAAPPQQRAELCESILSQVVRMREMTQRLHPSHARALAGVCDRIVAIAEARLGGNSASAAAAVPPPAPARAAAAPTAAAADASVTPQILKRLRSIFDILKDPAFLDSLSSLPPKEIRAIVARMRGEINELAEETEAKVTDPQQRKLIGGVIDNVVAILSQVSMLGATKVDGGTPVTPNPQPHNDEAEETALSAASYEAQKLGAERANNVAARLKQILKILEDPEYRSNPAPYRAALAEELAECREEIGSLPDETRLPLTQLMAKILEVFQLSLTPSASAAAQQQQQKKATAATQKDEEDDFEPSAAFDKVKKSLEAVFAAINSPAFQQGDQHTQNAFAQRLYGILQQIEAEIDTKVADPAEKEALGQLSGSLVGLVEKLIESTGPTRAGGAAVSLKQKQQSSAAGNASEDAPSSVGAGNAAEQQQPRVPITPQAAIAKVQAVKDILVNPQFGAMPAADQLTLAEGMLSDLKDVEAKITAASSVALVDPTAVPVEHVALYQKHVMPIIAQMRGAVEGLVVGLGKEVGQRTAADNDAENDAYANDTFEAEEEDGEENAEADDDDEEDASSNPRKGLFDTVRRATELIRAGRISTIADVKECMALLQDVDKVGLESEAERTARNEYMIAIRDLTQRLRDENDEALKAKQREYAATVGEAEAEDENDDDGEKKEEGEATGARPKSIAVLIAKMRLILEDLEYRADAFGSLSELLPYMTAVESMLAQFDGSASSAANPSWKSDPEAVEVVSETLSRIQDIQQALGEKEATGAREPSDLEAMLTQYTEMLLEGFEDGSVADRAHLAPFMEVVHQTRDVEGLTIEENKALMGLQKAIIATAEALSGEGAGDEDGDEEDFDKDVDEEEPYDEEEGAANDDDGEALPRDASGVEEVATDAEEEAEEAAATVNAEGEQEEPPKEGGEEEKGVGADDAEDKEDAASHLNFNGGVLGDDTTNSSVTATQANDATHASAHDGAATNDTTGPMPRLPTSSSDDATTIETAEEKIATTTTQNEINKTIETTTNDTPQTHQTDDEKKNEEGATTAPARNDPTPAADPAAANDVTPFFADEDALAAAELVPGALQQEVGLLPRMLERLQAGSEAFLADTSLFELYAMAGAIERLAASSILRGTEITKVVAAVRRLFGLCLRPAFVAALEEKGRREAAVVEAFEAAKAASEEKKRQKKELSANTPAAAAAPQQPNHNNNQHGKKGGKGKNKKQKQQQAAAAARQKQQQAAAAAAAAAAAETSGEEEDTSIAPPPAPIDSDTFIINHLLSFMRGKGAEGKENEGIANAYAFLRRATKDPQGAMADLPVRLTGMRSENAASGEGVFHYTVFSLEESGYGIDESFVAPLLRSEATARAATAAAARKKTQLPSPLPPMLAPAEDGALRLAFLVGPRGPTEEVGRAADSTEMAELAALSAILTGRYGFTVTTLVSNDMGAEEAEDEIIDAIAHHIAEAEASASSAPNDAEGKKMQPKRPIEQILVYGFTPNAPRTHPETGMPYPQYSLNFPSADHSTLPHRALLEAVSAACVGNDGAAEGRGACGHVTIVHDCGASLQVLAAAPVSLGGGGAEALSVGHHAALTLTEAAKSVANASRSWLFDGLFTPIICEMLTVARDDARNAADRDANVICAEDFVNYPAIVIGFKAESNDDDDVETSEDEKEEEGDCPHRLPIVGRSVVPSDRTLSARIL